MTGSTRLVGLALLAVCRSGGLAASAQRSPAAPRRPNSTRISSLHTLSLNATFTEPAAAARAARLRACGWLLTYHARRAVVLLLTDDQDLELGSMEAMPFTREVLQSRGTSFANFFAHTPVCESTLAAPPRCFSARPWPPRTAGDTNACVVLPPGCPSRSELLSG